MSHGLQELCAEVASLAAGRSCAPGISCPYVCERRSMCAGVQRAHSREVFGCGQVECMSTVYWRADRKPSTRMQGECMGEYVHVDRELSTQIQSRGSLKRG